jgi:hypothetical protein
VWPANEVIRGSREEDCCEEQGEDVCQDLRGNGDSRRKKPSASDGACALTRIVSGNLARQRSGCHGQFRSI